MTLVHPALAVLTYFTVIEALSLQVEWNGVPKRLCIPTTEVVGSCHECVCTVEGEYYCRAVTCRILKGAHVHWNSSLDLPEIRHGDPCIKGKVYRMDCNTCHCLAENSLACTKMACFHENDIKKITLRNDKLRSGLPEAPKGDCTPGKFYKKGCKQCFCEANKQPICSIMRDCTNVDKAPTSAAGFRALSDEEFQELPELSHQAVPCNSGVTYRIHCNTCLCLANGNLLCDNLLCPSYEDYNRLNAKSMSGESCEDGDTKSSKCIKCKCVKKKMSCEAKQDCNPLEDSKKTGRLGRKTREYLDLKQKKVCQPGMVYKESCNKCYCQPDRSMRCTQKTCLNYSQMIRLKKLRLRLEKEGL